MTKKKKPKKSKANRKQRAVHEYTAGGVVYRQQPKGLQILMIQDRQGRWTIPKGHVEKGERLEETAVREVKEETGLDAVELRGKLDKIHFFYRKEGKLIFMTTYVYLMEAKGNTDALVPEDSEGIADAQWFDQDKALEVVEYKDTKRLFRMGLKRLGVKTV